MNEAPIFAKQVEPTLDQALQAFAARPRVLVGLDFDGVLAPLVDDPATSRPLAASAAAVAELTALPGVDVAVISGRDADDVVVRADLPPGTRVVGSHGAQWGRSVPGPGGEPILEADPLDLTEEQAGLLTALRHEVGELVTATEGTEGAWVQTKPTAVVLHTRLAEEGAAQAVTDQVLAGPAAREGVRTVVGKDVVELAVLEVTKGDALVRLQQATGAEAMFYAGDDTTDEDAFTVLDPARDVSVKVGDGATAAGFRVETPEELAVVLTRLADLLRDRDQA